MFQPQCKSVGCTAPTYHDNDLCFSCMERYGPQPQGKAPSLSRKYPKYYKPVGDLKEIDVYAVHMLFDIQDPSGCIQHASKKLLLSGNRTGNKSIYTDIREARDSLDRWLELHGPSSKD